MTLTFEAPGFPAPVTIASETVIYTAPDRTELEQRSIRVNGIEFRGSGVPRLPIIEPERVVSPPLAITLSDLYRYRLDGEDTRDGVRCYVVAFTPIDPQRLAVQRTRLDRDRQLRDGAGRRDADAAARGDRRRPSRSMTSARRRRHLAARSSPTSARSTKDPATARRSIGFCALPTHEVNPAELRRAPAVRLRVIVGDASRHGRRATAT